MPVVTTRAPVAAMTAISNNESSNGGRNNEVDDDPEESWLSSDGDDDSDHKSDDESDDEDFQAAPPEKIFEASLLNKAYTAYATQAGKRNHLQIRQQIPSKQSLWDVIFGLELHFAPNLRTILEAPHPPTMDMLKSLPEFAYTDDYAFTIHLLILEKPEQNEGINEPPLIYIGSGTKKEKGVHDRFRNYDQDTHLSSLTTIAHKNGYRIAHKKVLVSTPCPTDYYILLSLFSSKNVSCTLETALRLIYMIKWKFVYQVCPPG
ncbi:hypothetical protein B0H65DRAFT_476671 [Neurospora tetraspora]|uniref:GIY-YIG domain-containing protein n=1 Tax=Neurospora tetraspora TaxID=94610 RepID=A0AAE0JA40_9PEZI|nr:hypothetical protein B0H65DRAFT_476671 [Neurospora tetraspora]